MDRIFEFNSPWLDRTIINGLDHGNVLSRFVDSEPRSTDEDDEWRQLLIRLTEYPGVELLIETYLRRPDNDLSFSKLPTDFVFPAYSICVWVGEEIVTTPYGDMPKLSIGLDKQVYGFCNTYFFDSNRNSIKEEYILDYSESLKDDDATLWNAPRIGIIPRVEDARFVPLDERDYKRMGFILSQVKSGVYSRRIKW